MTESLPHCLQRSIVIGASRETVFRFFTDSNRWASWWGSGSSIEARSGGHMRIRYPDGTEAAGEVIEVAEPERISFTYGYVSGKPIPPGSSQVTIRLTSVASGTELHLTHEFAEESVRDQHIQGWRFQLALFANAVADEVHGNASSVVDAWFAAWAIADDTHRDGELARIAAARVRFRDRFSLLEGLPDLTAHISASQRFMPGVRLRRTGDVRHCQGTVLADWVAEASDGTARMSGTNVFTFDADGRIDSVTGLLNTR